MERAACLVVAFHDTSAEVLLERTQEKKGEWEELVACGLGL